VVPVSLSSGRNRHADHSFGSAYDVFCKSLLWRAFHYQIPEDPRSRIYEKHTFEAYVALNRAFATAIIEAYETGDMSTSSF
jgi:trehalose-6-phosphate synthase